MFVLALLVSYLPWQLASTQANHFQALDYKPLYLSSKSARLEEPKINQEQPVDQTKLTNFLNSWAAAHSDHNWSVAVQSLDGPSFSGGVNQNQVYRSASVYKLLLMYQLFNLYQPADLGAINVNVEGRGRVSLESCVNLMISQSDNPCGVAVGNLLGWSKSTAALRTLGLTHTNLNDAAGPASTASDLNEYLVKLDKGELFNQADKSYILNLMSKQKYRTGIPAGCTSCIVANKTGDLGTVRHDVAIVSYSGGRYALSIFTNGASFGQIAELTSKIQMLITSQN